VDAFSPFCCASFYDPFTPLLYAYFASSRWLSSTFHPKREYGRRGHTFFFSYWRH